MMNSAIAQRVTEVSFPLSVSTATVLEIDEAFEPRVFLLENPHVRISNKLRRRLDRSNHFFGSLTLRPHVAYSPKGLSSPVDLWETFPTHPPSTLREVASFIQRDPLDSSGFLLRDDEANLFRIEVEGEVITLSARWRPRYGHWLLMDWKPDERTGDWFSHFRAFLPHPTVL